MWAFHMLFFMYSKIEVVAARQRSACGASSPGAEGGAAGPGLVWCRHKKPPAVAGYGSSQASRSGNSARLSPVSASDHRPRYQFTAA